MSSLNSNQISISQEIKAYFAGLAALIKPRNIRASTAYAHDVLMTGFAFVAAIYLQAGWQFLIAIELPLWKSVICCALVSAGTFSFTRLYRSLWCYASLPDMVLIAKSMAISTILFIPLYFLSSDLSKLPFAVLAVNDATAYRNRIIQAFARGRRSDRRRGLTKSQCPEILRIRVRRNLRPSFL